jgi:hypothetical protein
MAVFLNDRRREMALTEEQVKKLLKQATDDLHMQMQRELGNARSAIAEETGKLSRRLEGLEQAVERMNGQAERTQSINRLRDAQ